MKLGATWFRRGLQS